MPDKIQYALKLLLVDSNDNVYKYAQQFPAEFLYACAVCRRIGNGPRDALVELNVPGLQVRPLVRPMPGSLDQPRHTGGLPLQNV